MIGASLVAHSPINSHINVLSVALAAIKQILEAENSAVIKKKIEI